MALLNGTDVFLPKIYKKDIIDFEIETSVFPAQINGGAKSFFSTNREIVRFFFFCFTSFSFLTRFVAFTILLFDFVYSTSPCREIMHKRCT